MLWVFVVLSFPPDVLHLECQCDATSAKSLPPPGCWLAGSSEMVGAFSFLGAPLACRCFLIIRCELLRTWFWSKNIYRGVQHCWLVVLGLLFQSQEIWRESLIGAICYRSGSLLAAGQPIQQPIVAWGSIVFSCGTVSWVRGLAACLSR